MAVNYRGKKFYNIGPWCQLEFNKRVLKINSLHLLDFFRAIVLLLVAFSVLMVDDGVVIILPSIKVEEV
jgi:hypothetical protein